MTSTLDPQNLHRACQSKTNVERTQAYQQLGEFLLRSALSRLHSKPELHPHAQECTQEVLVTIWRKLEAGLGPDHPQQFLSLTPRFLGSATQPAKRRPVLQRC